MEQTSIAVWAFAAIWVVIGLMLMMVNMPEDRQSNRVLAACNVFCASFCWCLGAAALWLNGGEPVSGIAFWVMVALGTIFVTSYLAMRRWQRRDAHQPLRQGEDPMYSR